MKTYEEIADAWHFSAKLKARYVSYMRARWADEEATQREVGYAAEWAGRFANGLEYAASDMVGQSLLDQMKKAEVAND